MGHDRHGHADGHDHRAGGQRRADPGDQPAGCVSLACNFSGVGSADPNTGDTFTYLWNCGDGTPTSTSSSPSHTFPAAGTYTVTLTATDGWGKARAQRGT